MRLTKTASGKPSISMTRKEWEKIGKQNGWTKKAADLHDQEAAALADAFNGRLALRVRNLAGKLATFDKAAIAALSDDTASRLEDMVGAAERLLPPPKTAAQAEISRHLHEKPWQVATSEDSSLPIRKWDHLGTVWAVSAKSAAYQARADKKGDIVRTLTLPGDSEAIAFEFSDGSFVRVH